MKSPNQTPPLFNVALPLRRSCRGVTMIELSITLAIISILMASLPAMSSMGASMKLSSFSNAFLSELYFARSEAIKRNSRVVICKSANGTLCSTSGGWEQGWIIFHDVNNDGIRADAEPLIRRGEALPDGYSFSGNQPVAHYISFSPVGSAQLTSGGFQAGTVTLCAHSSEQVAARQVVINAVGKPRIQKTSLAFCG